MKKTRQKISKCCLTDSLQKLTPIPVRIPNAPGKEQSTTAIAKQGIKALKKPPFQPNRIRKIIGSFAFIEHCFLRQGFWSSLSHHRALAVFVSGNRRRPQWAILLRLR